MKVKLRRAGTGKPKPNAGARKHRSPVGAAPGLIVADPNAEPSHLTLIGIGPEGNARFDDIDFAEVEQHRAEWPVIWLDCTGLRDVGLIERIGAAFGLHLLSLEDVVNTHQRPKADLFDGHAYVVLRMTSAAGGDNEQLSLFFGENFVVTFQERPGDSFGPVRDRIARNSGRLRTSKADYLAYALIDAVVDGYFPVLEAWGDAVDAIEDEILAAPDGDQVAVLYRLRREMLVLKRHLWPIREAVAVLTRSEAPWLRPETRTFLGDVQDHAVRLIDMMENNRDTVAGLIDLHTTVSAARTSEVINLLTMISTIFIPLSFLAGVWGMNFNTEASPWNMPELNWFYGYPMALTLMAVVGLGLLLFFKSKRWL